MGDTSTPCQACQGKQQWATLPRKSQHSLRVARHLLALPSLAICIAPAPLHITCWPQAQPKAFLSQRITPFAASGWCLPREWIKKRRRRFMPGGSWGEAGGRDLWSNYARHPGIWSCLRCWGRERTCHLLFRVVGGPRIVLWWMEGSYFRLLRKKLILWCIHAWRPLTPIFLQQGLYTVEALLDCLGEFVI